MRKKYGTGKGALWIIATMLIASALVRFSAAPALAIASELAEEAKIDPDAIEGPKLSEQLAALLEEVKAREAALSLLEEQMNKREQILALVEEEVKKDIAHLERAEAELGAMIAVADAAAESDIARLTAVYENMKPEHAAALFQRMSPSFAAGFLGRMRADAAATILAGLEPDLAYSISVELAGRNANLVETGSE